MILSKTTKIKINKQNRTKFIDKFPNVEIGDIIDYPVCLLSKHSRYKINVKCDFCNNEKEISYTFYNKNISNGGLYACSSLCAVNKIKKTKLDKYGNENYNNITKNQHIYFI